MLFICPECLNVFNIVRCIFIVVVVCYVAIDGVIVDNKDSTLEFEPLLHTFFCS